MFNMSLNSLSHSLDINPIKLKPIRIHLFFYITKLPQFKVNMSLRKSRSTKRPIYFHKCDRFYFSWRKSNR